MGSVSDMVISYAKRKTRNLGNYESVSIEIKVEDEVNREIETSEECLIRLKTFVTNNIDKEMEATKSSGAIKQQIVELLNLDENNKIIIKNILVGFGANKVSDLNEKDLSEMSKKLIKLRANYE